MEEDTLENRTKLRLAFADADMRDYYMIERMQFVPGWTDFRLNNGLKLDILVKMVGLEQFSFDECLQIAAKADIEGVIVPFIHLNQLIINKKEVNRPKDQLDVIELEKIKELRKDMGLDKPVDL